MFDGWHAQFGLSSISFKRVDQGENHPEVQPLQRSAHGGVILDAVANLDPLASVPDCGGGGRGMGRAAPAVLSVPLA